jgi:hypothetical protein
LGISAHPVHRDQQESKDLSNEGHC